MKNKLELLVQPADLRQPPCSRPPPCGLLSEAQLTAVKLNKLRSKSEFTIQVTTVLSCLVLSSCLSCCLENMSKPNYSEETNKFPLFWFYYGINLHRFHNDLT